jgi:hypothetical protein
MGSWDEICGVSRLPIQCGDPVYVLMLGRVDGYYFPASLPFKGKYADYGGVELDDGEGESWRAEVFEQAYGKSPASVFDRCEELECPLTSVTESTLYLQPWMVHASIFDVSADFTMEAEWASNARDRKELLNSCEDLNALAGDEMVAVIKALAESPVSSYYMRILSPIMLPGANGGFQAAAMAPWREYLRDNVSDTDKTTAATKDFNAWTKFNVMLSNTHYEWHPSIGQGTQSMYMRMFDKIAEAEAKIRDTLRQQSKELGYE